METVTVLTARMFVSGITYNIIALTKILGRGTIGGSQYGVAKKASLIAVKVLDNDG